MKYLTIAIGIALAGVFGFLIHGNLKQTFGNSVGNGSIADACTINSVTAVAVGNQLATTILSSYGNRAWAILQQPANATNTVSVAFGNTATVGSGIQLTPATTTSPVPFTKFGLNTELPFTGSVSVITSTGSTTLLLTTCNY